jgi:magnesium transporter
VWRVVLAEVKVGVVNGVALGVLIGLVAWAWQGNLWLGLVVGVALALNTVIAVCVGGGVPLALKRMGRDPARAAGPILTTITDMCGFLLVLTLASLAIGKLAP